MLTVVLGLQRSPDSQTIELDSEFLETITVQGREYQRFSIDNHVYFGPIDDVRRNKDEASSNLVLKSGRRKHNVLILSSEFFRPFSMTV